MTERKTQPWPSALALAVALVAGLGSTDALALALGRVTVLSALGEPLRAEIEIPEARPDELAALRARVAPADAFRAAGVDYNAALANAEITLVRRPNGTYFLRVTSSRVVNEPFVDLILEASWPNGRIVRDYTMLFDPPNLRTPAPPLAAQVPAPPLTAQVPPPPATARPSVTESQPGRPAATPSAPPVVRAPAPAPATATAPEPAPAPRAAAPEPAPTPAPRAAAPEPAPTPRAAAPEPAPTPRAAAPEPAPARPAARAPASAGEPSGQRVTVRRGDTAGRIAAAHLPMNVSLDQMLLALLRSNPQAFIGGNVNRLRAGAVLDVPTAEQAGNIGAQDARRQIVAQSRDFNEFRRRLAEGVPTTRAPGASRQAAGRVTGEVEERRAGGTPADRLMLSKGATARGGSAEEQIARDRAAQDQATRLAELNRNIQELNRLGAATPGAPAAPGTAGRAGIAAPPGVPVSPAPGTRATADAGAPAPAGTPAAGAATGTAPAPATTAAPAPAPGTAARETAGAAPATTSAATPPAPAPATATTPAAGASAAAAATTSEPASPSTAAPAAAAAAGGTATAAAPAGAAPSPAPAARPPAPPPAVEEPSFVDGLMENPLLPAVGVAALALLLGLGFYKLRQRRKGVAQVDSSFLESRLQPDSFFGASGGQRVDTAESSTPTGSSMIYSPSQLDAAGDVDPVAEADVYLAYGRDLQAEEILKEALRTNPQRVAIHAKLLEIYAKRRDVQAFEAVANDAYVLTGGTGPEWEHITDLGAELDPSNPLYRPGGRPGAGAVPGAATAAVAGAAGGLAAEPAPSEMDLDLDFSLPDEAAAAPAPATSSADRDEPLEFTAEAPAAPEFDRAPPLAEAPASTSAPAASMDFDLAGPEPAAPAAATAQATEPTFDLDFDLAPAGSSLADADTGAGLPPPAGTDPSTEGLPDLTLAGPDFDLVTEPPAGSPAPAGAAPELMDFDLGSLSLDLPGQDANAPAPLPERPPTAPAGAAAGDELPEMDLDLATSPTEDPLATKLALAEEFNAIGDTDGARSLAEEVLADATGELRARAQRLLADIG